MPSIEVPVGDFFCNGWHQRCNANSLLVTVNAAGGFNSCCEMPFQRRTRLAIESFSSDELLGLY